jgi:ribosomal protein S18 acetylase RimI-like enzyme
MAAAGDWLIRPVLRAEASAWRTLRAEMLQNHPTAFSSAYEDFVRLRPAAVAARIPEPGGADVLLGVYLDGVLSGSAGFAREAGLKSQHQGTMWGVYLCPALRGRGVGEALTAAVITHARAHVDLLLCAVSSDNLGAKALYLRMGFRAYGTRPRALRWGGRDYDEDLLMMDFTAPA